MTRVIRLLVALVVGVAVFAAVGGEAEAATPGPDIVVIGGTAAVSAGLADHLSSCTSGSLDRIGGANRYETAALLSTQMSGVETVFLATGSNFPDAIAAGSVAALDNSPILLVKRDSIPLHTDLALQRIAPKRVVILGGTSVVGTQVESKVRSRVGNVIRLGGVDRFATAAAVSGWYFTDPSAVSTVYVAVGSSFIDAMAAGPAATRDTAPILLVTRDKVPTATAAEIERLSPDRIVIVGGELAIGASVEAELATMAGSTSRMAGESRWSTAAAAAVAGPASDRLFVVTGTNFPDGLAAIPVAAGSPILLVAPNELHQVTADAISKRTSRECAPWTPPYPQFGTGKRVIYSLDQHRLWMIDESERLVDTYLVTGRVGIPHTGTYQVFSKSLKAYAPYGGITMRHMVRFVRPGTWGNQWSYGFHSIPRYSDGRPLMTEDALGSYGSGGCVRQADAKAAVMYDWADIGTTVIVIP